MSTDNTFNYRARIYENYVNAGLNPLAPHGLDPLEGFQARLYTLRAMVRRLAPPDKQSSILDLGCGHGAIVYALRQAGYQHVRGIDVSPEQVEAARRLGVPGVVQGDIMEALAATACGSSDCVITYDVIEHLTKSELIDFVDEVHRVLSPGGRWIIHVPNGESPFFGRIRYSDFSHELTFTRFSLTQLLKASGFATVDCFEDRPVAHGVKSAVRAVLWGFLRLGWLCYIAIECGVFDRGAIFSQNLTAVATTNSDNE
ncbi:class I SAM-dependent methyltransferase [uncultured Thiodictyon sp.]|uniref:class I SAM-dependent methyltransferase n=1 Tax=uncultured Thiodictyon sp. TaxID=1846217 RepID=UPI0025EF7237|nr:class I SAM-dependent methyltransferase [uncultured Thiodictyon sp.]